MNFYQIFLPIATLLYFLLVFVLRSIILKKQTGVNAFVFGRSQKAHDYIGRVYKLLTLGTWISIALFSFLPDYYKYLLPFWYLENETLQFSGVVLVLISFGWTSIAQYQMSESWRIGIDYGEKTDLISQGLFKHSRNPIFLGVIISYFGTFCIIPNVLSFSLFLLCFVIIQIQVRMEEEYLESNHGQEYLSYKSKVRRWY